jgi:hypothetical protein
MAWYLVQHREATQKDMTNFITNQTCILYTQTVLLLSSTHFEFVSVSLA